MKVQSLTQSLQLRQTTTTRAALFLQMNALHVTHLQVTRQQDIANYNKAKEVWMANNPQQAAKPAMTEHQAAERQQKGK
jgi:hypothetical protein